MGVRNIPELYRPVEINKYVVFHLVDVRPATDAATSLDFQQFNASAEWTQDCQFMGMTEPENDYSEIVPQPERSVAGYRCKIYKALLDITSESDNTKRPLVDRSARWMINPTSRAVCEPTDLSST